MPKATLRVHLTPKSGRNELVRLEAGVLHARVSAPPVDGAANQALIVLLADRLRLRKSAIGIKSGASSREKAVEVEGVTPEELLARVQEAMK